MVWGMWTGFTFTEQWQSFDPYCSYIRVLQMLAFANSASLAYWFPTNSCNCPPFLCCWSPMNVLYLLCRQEPTLKFLTLMLQACYEVQDPPFPSPPPWTLAAWCCFCTDWSLSIASWIFLPRNSYFFRTIFLYSSSSRSRIRKKLFSSGRVNASHWNSDLQGSTTVTHR